MRVFRCLTAREITGMYTDNERKKYSVRTGENTFHYDKDKSYIHFFKYSKFAEYYFKSAICNFNPLDNFIAYMICNIPNDILNENFGYGLYSNVSDINIDYYPLPEYAIPSNLLKEYIIRINNFIEYEYKNDKEYELYISLLAKLAKTYKGDGHKIARYLIENNLCNLLNVKDDERDEKQIQNDYIKKLSFVIEDLKNE